MKADTTPDLNALLKEISATLTDMRSTLISYSYINDGPATGRLRAHLDELLVELDQVTNKQQRHEVYCRCGNLIAINPTGVPPAYCRDCQEKA